MPVNEQNLHDRDKNWREFAGILFIQEGKWKLLCLLRKIQE
jgi:hypothetical protein